MEETKTINKRVVNGYTIGNVLPSEQVLAVSSTIKLMYLQITPDRAIKKRKVGSTEIPYVEISYVERALNFVSNFRRGCEVTDKGIQEYKNDKGKEICEAWVQCNFYIELDWCKIERSAFGSWVSYANPAVSKFAVYQSALSIATKAFADTLGIGSDRKDIENDALKRAREDMEIATLADIKEWFTTTKSND